MKRSRCPVIKEVLGFLEAALMGCFFACFRIKDDDDRRKTRLSTRSIPVKNRDLLVSKNQLDFVPLFEERGSPCRQALRPCLQEDFDKDSISRGLEHEVKYLKSCGSLLETPADIQRVAGKIIVQTPKVDGENPDFHSWLPAASCKKLEWDEQLSPISDTPTQVDNNSNFPEHKSGGCNSDEHLTLTKIVQCEEIKHVSTVESGVESAILDISPSEADKVPVLGSKDSPYPTPLNLTTEMQTPGTVYPTNQENLRARRNGGIQTQYVYPVLKPVEHLSHLEELRQDTCLIHLSDHSKQEKENFSPDSRGRTQQISFTSASEDSKLLDSPSFSSPNSKISQDQNTISREESVHCESLNSLIPPFHGGKRLNSNAYTPKLVVSSLSQWLKPPLPKDEIRDINNITEEQPCSEKSSDADRPIIGIVASHWNPDELSHISPKWWDGNGIPNTTTKYKEDQKVSWHATPFEERLEKALSDDKLLPKRNLLNGRPIEFEHNGEEKNKTAF
ncbi:protein JASON [Elaeis guineensis]|uniref:Protein JASON n=1 Tax=Elaeis guineensis var. tenera TaxID=51953 RepID=A0A6I9SER3_ELAGV|nr:protein JASON [Elaeis guineensis]